MVSRLALQNKLEELNDNKNVYFQPPESLKMNYPAIKDSIDKIDGKFANDRRYISTRRYSLTVISKKPDPEIINKLLELPMCEFDRSYVSDNLNHYVFTIYW